MSAELVFLLCWLRLIWDSERGKSVNQQYNHQFPDLSAWILTDTVHVQAGTPGVSGGSTACVVALAALFAPVLHPLRATQAVPGPALPNSARRPVLSVLF